jgi:hypothetical protein
LVGEPTESAFRLVDLDIPNALSGISAGVGGVREICPLVSGIEYTTQAGAE